MHYLRVAIAYRKPFGNVYIHPPDQFDALFEDGDCLIGRQRALQILSAFSSKCTLDIACMLNAPTSSAGYSCRDSSMLEFQQLSAFSDAHIPTIGYDNAGSRNEDVKIAAQAARILASSSGHDQIRLHSKFHDFDIWAKPQVCIACEAARARH